MNINEIPTPETDMLNYLPTDIGPCWPLVEHSQGLERRLAIARGFIQHALDYNNLEGYAKGSAIEALTQTAPKS